MKRLTVTAALLFFAMFLQVDTANAGDVVVSDGWVRASIGAASNSAAYLAVTIEGEASDRLISAATPLAERSELHDHLMEDGVARMRHVEAIDMAPGETITFEPGGLHIMLMGLTKKLEPGDLVPMILSFENAGEIDIDLVVQPIDFRPAKSHHGHGDG